MRDWETEKLDKYVHDLEAMQGLVDSCNGKLEKLVSELAEMKARVSSSCDSACQLGAEVDQMKQRLQNIDSKLHSDSSSFNEIMRMWHHQWLILGKRIAELEQS